MSLDEIKALTFDTGRTILDWHSGFRTALADSGDRHGMKSYWSAPDDVHADSGFDAFSGAGRHVISRARPKSFHS